MNFGDLIGAGVIATGGGLRGQNAGDDELYRRRQHEEDQAAADALRRFVAERQGAADQARARYYDALTTKAQTTAATPPAPKFGSPEYNKAAIDLYGQKKAIDARYRRQFPSFNEAETMRKTREAKQRETDEGNAAMASVNQQQWAPFWKAYSAIISNDRTLTPGQAAARAMKQLQSQQPGFQRPNNDTETPEVIDYQHGGTPDNPTGKPPESDDDGDNAFWSNILQRGEDAARSGYEAARGVFGGTADPEEGEAPPEMDDDVHTAPETGEIEQQRAQWDELARIYGKQLTEQQVGPRP